MSDFLRFLDDLKGRMPIHVEIYYSKTMDWCITVYRKGMAADYPESKRSGDDAVMVSVQSLDMELAFAQAHVAIKEWLSRFEGGY